MVCALVTFFERGFSIRSAIIVIEIRLGFGSLLAIAGRLDNNSEDNGSNNNDYYGFLAFFRGC